MSLRERLLDRAAYPPECGGVEVQLIETHLSWVFLVGRDVYKVKKPVQFSFVDFSTLASRRAACDAEVVLNGRLSPEVYLGVVPIVEISGALRVGGDGPPVEYAVHMRRLSDDVRGDVLASRGELRDDEIDRWAELLARFHEGARCDAHTTSFGTVASILGNVEENFAQTREVLERRITPAEANEIRGYQRAFLETHGALFDARCTAGRVRDGHGDLRLEHVYVDPAGPTIIDCIEFNERFRFADVAADLAFLSMDLRWHARVDGAERLMAKYARASNDYDLYALVDFYESYRAFVRGKVCSMLEADEGASDELRERAATDARRYFRLALAAERPPLLAPRVVAIGGWMAAGKSTIAELVGDLLAAPILDADRTRKSMLGVASTRFVGESAWKGAYDPAFTEHVYAELYRRAGVVLDAGRSVVLDASFRSPGMRAAARALAEKHGTPFLMIECRAPVAVCRQRLAARERGAHVSDGRLQVFDDFLARFEAVTEIVAAEHLVLDTTTPLFALAARLRGALPTWPQDLRA